MIEIVKFLPKHWEEMEQQETTAYLRPLTPAGYTQALAESPFSYTAISEGRIVACSGVIEHWPGRAEAWAELAQISRKEFLAIHNAVKRFLEVCPYRRIEATVAVEFDAAHRWIKLLGFELEAPVMRKFGIDGGDCALYARIK